MSLTGGGGGGWCNSFIGIVGSASNGVTVGGGGVYCSPMGRWNMCRGTGGVVVSSPIGDRSTT